MRILRAVILLAAIAGADVTKTICSVGADYTTYSAFETAYSTSLTGMGVVSGLGCEETFSEVLTYSGQTNVSASDYLLFGAQAGAEADGVFDAGPIISGSANGVVKFQAQYGVLQDIQVNNSIGSASNTIYVTSGGGNTTLRRVLVKSTGVQMRALAVDLTGSVNVQDCVFWGTNASNSLEAVFVAATTTILNTTVLGHNGGVNRTSATATVTNTAVKRRSGASAACFVGTITQSYNACDGTATGTGSLSSVTGWGFTNEAIGDVSISAASAMVNAGTTGTATDVRRTARPQGAATDIGAFEYVAAVAPTTSSRRCGPRSRFLGGCR